MPVFLLSLVARTGIPARFQRLAAWAAAIAFAALVVALLALAFRGWLHNREQTAVTLDRQDVTIEAANRVINATSAATVNQMARDDAFADDQEELRHDAQANSTADPVGPGVRSVLDRMREQQSASRR